MNPIQIISQDVFDKIRSRFQNLEMGDEMGAVTIDPAEARFFDFDFVNEGVNLGRVSISLNDIGSLKVYYSQGITENQDEPAKKLWYSFLREMRLFAMRRLLRFDTRDIAKNNLDKNDFQYLATKGAPKEEPMSMNESRWSPKSTKKTSRAVRGATEVIVRHTEAVDELYAGARSQPKKIKAIFIQNHDGERFKYPFIHPAGAFAMAQHVDHGGIPHDPAGKAIIRMSEQIAQLQEFGRHVRSATLHDDATGIVERTNQRLHELKAQVDALGKRQHYEAWMETFADTSTDADTVLDDVTMEQYKQTFTQTNFKEELSKFFPLIHNIMSETNEINLEDYVGENKDEHCDACDRPVAKCVCDDEVKESAFDAFEEWADATEQGKLTDDQVQALKQAIEKLQPGELSLKQGGQLAADFFAEFGLEDPELAEKLKSMASIDDTTDPMQVLQAWAKEAYPELLVAIGISGTGGGEQEPAPEPEAEPEVPPSDVAPEEPEMEDDEQEEPRSGGNMIQEIAEKVKQFYNKDNESVGPFRGYEGIAIDIGKQCAEKYGEDAGNKAEAIAKQFMEKLTQQWEQKHGQVPGPVDQGGDGLARLKELVGNIKTKVEGMSGKPEMEEKDDWHPSKHVTDPQKKKELAPHDKDVQRGSYKDRADYLDKGGVPRSESAEMESILKLAGLAK